MRWLTRPLGYLTAARGVPTGTAYDWRERVGWSVLAIGLYPLGWYATGALVVRLGRFVDVSTAFDRAIPLVVELSWGYAMIFVLVAAAVLFIRERRVFLMATQGAIAQTLVSWVFFVAMPVKMALRPDEAALQLDGPSATLTSFFYFIDPPLNCFPSMHLALGVWSGLMLIEDRPRLKWVVWPIIWWIAVSVLLIRQHYLLDAVAGTSLALATRWWFRRHPPRGV
jgi:membrane-associated phospholipid phosphatase